MTPGTSLRATSGSEIRAANGGVGRVFVYEYRPGRIAVYIDNEFDHVYPNSSPQDGHFPGSVIHNVQALISYLLDRVVYG